MDLEPNNEYCIGLYNSDTGSETRVRAYITIAPPSGSDSSGLGVGAVIAIVAAVIAVIALVAVGVIVIILRKRKPAIAMPEVYNQVRMNSEMCECVSVSV